VDLFSTSVWLLGFGLLALLLSVSNPRAFFSFRDQSKLKVGGMLRFNDTRRFYAYGTALLPYLKQGFKNTHPFMAQGLRMRAQARTVFVSRAIGMQGYAAGPGKILVDQYALSDALLARLPVKDPWNWRIAHFARRIPKGYLESLGTGQNKIEDPALWQYYEKLRLVTQGPLFSRQRLRTVFEFNLGYYDKWLKQYLQSRPKAP
jgi:arabinofuranosyltransferase